MQSPIVRCRPPSGVSVGDSALTWMERDHFQLPGFQACKSNVYLRRMCESLHYSDEEKEGKRVRILMFRVLTGEGGRVCVRADILVKKPEPEGGREHWGRPGICHRLSGLSEG